MKQVMRALSASLHHVIAQVSHVCVRRPKHTHMKTSRMCTVWRVVLTGLVLTGLVLTGVILMLSVELNAELIGEASAQPSAQSARGRRGVTKRVKRNRASRNASPTTFETPRAIVYADTGILDIRREEDKSWSVGLWRNGQLITRYPCKARRCTLKIPKEELSDLLNRWNQETGGRDEEPESEAKLTASSPSLS